MTEDRNQKIRKLRALPAALEEAVKGLNDRQLDTPYREGGWTVRQLVHHLADAQLNGFARVKLMITEQKPAIKTWDQDAWAELPDATRMPVGVSLEIVRGVHDRWVYLLERMGEADWTRTATHPEWGEITVDRLLTIYADHGEKHVAHIMSLRNARHW